MSAAHSYGILAPVIRSRPHQRRVSSKRGTISPEGTLVLSPHADDAALSLGATLVDRALPQPVTIITVFGRTDFCDGARDAETVTALRRDEDRAFCRWAGIDLEHWSFEDACVRHPAATIAELLAPRETEPLLVESLAMAFGNQLACRQPQLLLAPLGIGGHIDHRLVRSSGVRAALAASCPLWLYADQPYALLHAGATTCVVCPVVRVVCTPEAVAIKQAAASHYPSQPAARNLRRQLRLERPGAALELAVAV